MSTGRQTFPPARRPLMSFLTLAPSTSPLTAEALAGIPKVDGISPDAHAEMKRRTSSLSSDGSKTGLRFLKLNHIHQDTKGDFAEVAVE